MPTANGRYGRPKGSGLDDRQQLASLAALLAANPKLKPTTAIRSLGVENPSAIRRLRDKFRAEQAKLMAEARRAMPSNGARPPRKSSPARAPEVHGSTPSAPTRETPAAAAGSIPSCTIFVGWYEFACSAASLAVASQSAATQYWLGLPPVSIALRGQLAFNAALLATYSRSKTHPLFLH